MAGHTFIVLQQILDVLVEFPVEWRRSPGCVRVALADKVLEVASPTVSNIQAPHQAQQATVCATSASPSSAEFCTLQSEIRNLTTAIAALQTERVTLYGLAPENASKGVIRGVLLHFSDTEILANLNESQFEIHTCRRLGQHKLVILTFAGLKVRANATGAAQHPDPEAAEHSGAQVPVYLQEQGATARR
ncbi:hypothetical protein HPB47_020357 [Ixodes persulcatus]|uniref:Uncharacterized protein n=1 Tax=Ixodes persulcatus TaxID=34615 RepID=A0AC60QFQ9_IXOPE|nr:hypothetical protein HPB47_020357 [Ixodes persulcatus]